MTTIAIPRRPHRGRIHCLGAIPLALLLAACTSVTNPVSGQRELTVMDEQAEIAEGKKAHAGVLAEYGVVKDAKLQAYVDELGQKLAKSSQRANLQWTFTVLDSPEVNAFATPGGYVYVTRGIMATMESEADLAGVIGHEIGHVTARHGAQRATRQQAAGIGVLAASVLGAVAEAYGVPGAGQLVGQASQGAAAGYIASYSRDQELQADRLGADYLVRNHYDPKNMVDVIGVLKMQEQFAADQARAAGRQPRQGGDWLASHPSNEQRLDAIKATAAGYAKSAAPGTYADDGRERYLQAIGGMVYGSSREQGVVRGPNFYHEPLGIALTAPAGWRIQNGQDAVALVNAAGDAGLVLKTVPAKAGSSHEEIIRSLIQPTQGKVEKRSLNGLAASHFVGQRQNQQGQSQPVQATIVTGPANSNYLLLYAAKDAAARERALPQLREAEASFRAMSAADRKAAEPWTIRAVPYPRGGFAELAKRSPLQPAELAERQLRLINGVYGGGEPKPGQLVKIID
ncbi:M48 family metalloprotease [Rivibacter subsaxonicus]|uniref:Putative Zn-dependent protease n=1 Tax=Rivibacter subsaxonicus TaxID=457575 RepID=A0A4Q7W165_9BURK|nr:M48 family metalloprotease [Rivibacter subsaxonicus]RZU02994.1 putative Zn-dependent protease [Rivibacter subsaxonicus]